MVTQDDDFTELVYLYPKPIKVIWMCVGNSSTAERERKIRVAYEQLEAFAHDPNSRLFIIR